MTTDQKATDSQSVSLKQPALISGFGLLVMVFTAPIAELYILPKLIDFGDAAKTLDQIINEKQLFILAIFLYLITFIADVVVAWGLYSFFKPHNKGLSLLTAWFRLIYTALALFGLFNLIKVLQLIKVFDPQVESAKSDLASQTMFYLRSFGAEWGIAFVFFGICLGLLGYLAIKAAYVPKWIGFLLVLAGAGYFIDSIKPYFFPDLDTSIIMITFFGELVFMFWLLFKGRKLMV